MTPLSLPLTTFEEYLLWEDRLSYPWSCFARLQFTGQIDRKALETALRAVMPRHPLLASRLERRGGRPFWNVQPGAMPQIEWLAGPTGGALPAAGRQDLREEIGLRLFVTENGASCDVTLQFHHACCDGAGIEVFVNDLLIAYALARSAAPSRLRLPKLDSGRLARRGTYGLTCRKLLTILPRQVRGLWGAGQFFARSPAPLLPHRALPDDDPPPNGYPATCTHVFTREESAAFHKAARRLNVTSNDLLIRDVFVALAQWRVRHGAGDDGAWLRMMVPMNLRSRADRLLPAANGVGSVFLDRRGRDFADPGQLLAGIARELQFIKDRELGLIFIYTLNLLGLIPGGLRINARRDQCTVSSIFSNIGMPLRRCPLPRENGRLVAGDVVLEQIDGTVPIRPYNCVSFLVNDYAHRLSVMLHYDPRQVSEIQADDLAATFARCVRATAAANF